MLRAVALLCAVAPPSRAHFADDDDDDGGSHHRRGDDGTAAFFWLWFVLFFFALIVLCAGGYGTYGWGTVHDLRSYPGTSHHVHGTLREEGSPGVVYEADMTLHPKGTTRGGSRHEEAAVHPEGGLKFAGSRVRALGTDVV